MRQLGPDARAGASRAGPPAPRPLGILQWVYLGRVLVALAVFLSAAFYFAAVPPGLLLTLAIAALASFVASGASAFYTHVAGRHPGPTFIYLQAMFDLVLVTTVVHVTGGAESEFIPLYILVIAVAAVLLPLWSALLVTFLASALFVADVVIAFPALIGLTLWLQVAVFLAVALATGWIGSRVRIMGREREALEQEMRRLRLEAQDILRSIGSGVLTVDADGALLYANPAAEHLLAFDAAPLLGRSVMTVVAARSPVLAEALDATLREGVRRQRLEGQVQLDGRVLTIGLTTTRLEGAEHGVPSATAIFTDISDQKRLEDLKVRAERLEAVAELAASLAHEIKNPLASIRSSVEQLTRGGAQTDDERTLGRLVLRESDRLSRLLSEFLEFARVRVAMSRPVDLRHVAESAAELVRRHPSAQAATEIVVAGACRAVPGDEDLLHRLVVNLILNAVQAAGGDVRVRVTIGEEPRVSFPEWRAPSPAAVLTVADDGPGLPDDVRARLFQPFVSRRPGGVGLGLAVVHRTVEAHHGVIHVDSAPGAGTTFTVLLPIEGAAQGGS
jgi:two-component system, NtrC family, sensor histidine kinase PilS